MSLSAWITSILVALILYGGFAWSVAMAVRRERRQHDASSEEPGRE
jgi:hypothetical protein